MVTGCDSEASCEDSDTCPAHSTCHAHWDRRTCDCDSGYVGDSCYDACHLNPCQVLILYPVSNTISGQ